MEGSFLGRDDPYFLSSPLVYKRILKKRSLRRTTPFSCRKNNVYSNYKGNIHKKKYQL